MTSPTPSNGPWAVVIGGGPAGLMAAETLARAGHPPMVIEAKPTLARKFLMAGKSGLNLTKDESPNQFAKAYRGGFPDIVATFGPSQMIAFARDLGIELFTGSTGRVFPTGMKASPFLRAWTARLADMGVTFHTRWRWTGFNAQAFVFDTPTGAQILTPTVTILALGGASWPKLGSDAAWVPWLAEKGVDIAPFRPANMGFDIGWSAHMTPFFGQPVKGAALVTPTATSRGEFVLSARGIEGGGVYSLSANLRDGAPLALDLVPDIPVDQLARRLSQANPRDSLTNRLRKTLHLDGARLALVNEWGRPLPTDALALARRLKSLPIAHLGPRPLAEAISSAGGITAGALTPALELKTLPGVFAAGEMLDWEAPTGGYLLTGCFASGQRAGQGAAQVLAR